MKRLIVQHVSLFGSPKGFMVTSDTSMEDLKNKLSDLFGTPVQKLYFKTSSLNFKDQLVEIMDIEFVR